MKAVWVNPIHRAMSSKHCTQILPLGVRGKEEKSNYNRFEVVGPKMSGGRIWVLCLVEDFKSSAHRTGPSFGSGPIYPQ